MQDVSDVGPMPSVADLRTVPGRSAAAFSVPPDQIILPDGVLNHRWTYHAPPNQPEAVLLQQIEWAIAI